MSLRADLIRKWVDQYRKWGWQPLPSDPTPGGRKKPLIRFADHWEKRMDWDPFTKFPEANIQLMTGCAWNLLVVDVDGDGGREAWEALRRGRYIKTWTVESGSGGLHLWFQVPRGVRKLDTVRLWGVWDAEKKGWERDKSVERLCDRKLIMAPPSIHPETGNTYQFLPGSSPREMTLPAVCPRWILELPEMPNPQLQAVRSAATRPEAARKASSVLDAVNDKMSLARSWGLKLASDRPNAAGWCECHVYYREDRHPSAMFSPSTGRYWDPETGRQGISLIELAVGLGAYQTYADAVRALAADYRVN